MGFFCDLWDSIWELVGQILEAIWTAIVWIFENILPALLIVLAGVLVFTGILAVISPVAAGAFVSAVSAFTTGIVELSLTIITGAFDFAVAAIDALATGFATFLEFINFDAILEIHELLMIVSDDYRAMIAQLYDAISEASEAIFGTTYMLHLFFKNTSNLIANAGTLMGWDWDVTQLEWFMTFDAFAVKFNEKAEQYMETPEDLLYDLEDWSERSAIDVATETRRAEIELFGVTINGLARTARDLKGLHDDYNAFQFALPAERIQIIKKYTDPILGVLGDFQFSTYERHRLETNWMVKENRDRQEASRQRIIDIDWQQKRPSRGLSRIDELGPVDREGEEVTLEEYSSREYGRDNVELVKQHDERIEKEEAEKPEPEIVLPPPGWEAIVEKEVVVLAMEKSKRRDSPFVGDY